MRTRVKKIIAREYLILIGCLIVPLISYGVVLMSNKIKISRIKNIKHSINLIEEKLKEEDVQNTDPIGTTFKDAYEIAQIKDYKRDTDYFFQQAKIYRNKVYKALKGELGDIFDKTENEFNYTLDNDKTYVNKVYRALKEELGDTFTKTENEFFERIYYKAGIISKIESAILKIINEYRDNTTSSDENLQISAGVLVVTIIILFPVRYLYYATEWSVKQLNRQQDS